MGQFWFGANPAMRDYLDRVNRARALAFSDSFRAIGRWLAGLVRKLVDAAQTVRQQRETYYALQSLDDRTLKDIGVARSELHAIARSVAADQPARRRGRAAPPHRHLTLVVDCATNKVAHSAAPQSPVSRPEQVCVAG